MNMSFEDDLKAELEAETDWADVDIVLKGKPYVVRLTQLDGTVWADLTDRFPARPGVLLDANYGYNLRGLAPVATPMCGKLIDGDKVSELTEEQWADLFKALPGSRVMRIGDVLWNLNEYLPNEAVLAAKKGSAARSAKKSG